MVFDYEFRTSHMLEIMEIKLLIISHDWIDMTVDVWKMDFTYELLSFKWGWLIADEHMRRRWRHRNQQMAIAI